MFEIVIGLVCVLIPVTLACVFVFSFLSNAQYLESELVHMARYALGAPSFRDSSFFRRLAYRTMRLRVRQSPSGFHVEGNVFHSPLWISLERYEELAQANEFVVKMFDLASEWLKLDKQGKVVGTYSN